VRIVSLAPGITELCFELGCGEDVVGVDEHSDRPTAVAELPTVGTLSEPDVRAIRELAPDLILVFDLAPGRVSPPSSLQRAGAPVEVLSATRLEDVGELFRTTARLLDVPDRGARLAGQLESGLEARRSRLAPLEPRPRVYVELWPRPPLALGRESWIHDLLGMAGGDNVFGDRETPNVEVDAESVGSRDPDLMLLTWGSLATRLEPVLRREGWQAVDAVRRRRVASVAVDALKRPVPRLVSGFETLASVLRETVTGPPSGARPPSV